MSTTATYQVVFLGLIDARFDCIADLLGARLVDLGIEKQSITLLHESDADSRDRSLPTIAVFLGYVGASDADHPAISDFLSDSNIFVTIVSDLSAVTTEIPVRLHHINAIEASLPDYNFDRIASLLLEGFRLLRKERRLFISYKRLDSQAVANQLYDALDARGFDVFIDTRSVPPGIDFQAELWHRLSDSDVVILIDTPGFRLSRWTTEELARANATNIQILHLLWPGQPEDVASAFSNFHALKNYNFKSAFLKGNRMHLKDAVINTICQRTEQLRARAIAARHRYLVDSFCDTARDYGFLPNVQPQRWISIALTSGKELAVVPIIGIPTSDRMNQVFDAISQAGSGSGGIWVLYDNRGILNSWSEHLNWLDTYLPTKSIRLIDSDKAIEGL